MIPLTDLNDDLLCPLGAKRTPRTAPPGVGTVEKLERELERKRRFVSDASHELRTPITGLRMELEEARLNPDQIDLGDLLDRALSGVDRLDAILTDLHHLSALELGAAIESRRVDLGELARIEVSRRADRLPVELRLEPGVIVDAVPTQLGRVLTNLLDNAQRHAEQVVGVRVRRDGDDAVLAVEDDGDGVAEADRDRIFERFTRLEAARRRDHKMDRRGTGLGLAISYDIAQAHRGRLGVGNSATGGACFTLRLPSTAPAQQACVPAISRHRESGQLAA